MVGEGERWIRAINFDLEKDKLKVYYPKKNYRQAYRDIKKFLKGKDFVHRQWSGYRSIKKLSDKEVIFLVGEMKNKFPWLSMCARRFDVTNVMNVYDLLPIFRGIGLEKDKDVSIDNYEVDLSSMEDRLISKKLPLKDIIKNASAVHEENLKSNPHKQLTPDKINDIPIR